MKPPALSIVRITAENITRGDGTPLPPGTILSDPEAWRHCFPRYGGLPAIAEPCDDETRAFCEWRAAERAPVIAAAKAQFQRFANAMAKRLKVDPTTGTFAMTASGSIVGIERLKDWEKHQLELCVSHGIKPELPAAAAAESGDAAASPKSATPAGAAASGDGAG